jgi:uncharacterized alpha-E superfamily protein
MLSRVADALYWTTRYVERAEDTSRLLHVNFHGLLDADTGDHGGAWRDLLFVVGGNERFREHFDEYSAQAVTEFLLWHPENPDSVAACIAHARENARGVRDEISSEMWEHLNRLHLDLAGRRRASVLGHPHDFLAGVMGGSQAFLGITSATLPRGEAYEFLVLGTSIERADAAARLISVKLASLLESTVENTLENTLENTVESVAAARATQVLKSCGTFEAFQKATSDSLRPARVVEYVLLDRRAPRAVLFCLDRCLGAIRAISPDGQRPERAVGRVVAELSFAEVVEHDPAAVAGLVSRVLHGIGDAGLELAAAYFTTRVIVPGPYSQQQQQ